MIDSNILKRLFKPHKSDSAGLIDLLTVCGVDERKFWKIQFEQECSKATDESCINTDCRYNYMNMHQNELYVDLMCEIQAERNAVENRINGGG